MKIIKIAIIVMTAIIALILIVALFAPGEYAVEKTVTINKPSGEVFDYIKLLKNQDNYSVWSSIDPDMKKTFKGEDGKVGFTSAWQSTNPNIGRGEQEIVSIEEGKRINFQLRFKEPFEANDNAYMTVTAISDSQTKTTWGFTGKMKYPTNLMLLFMSMEDQLGPQLEEGLSNLKSIMEK